MEEKRIKKVKVKAEKVKAEKVKKIKVKDLGYNYEIWVYDRKGNIIDIRK